MNKKLILVGAPPACGKNYVSERICRRAKQITYLDKDDLGGLLHRTFALCNQEIYMEGDFYLQNLRDEEYATLLRFAFSALRFSDLVLVNAPFIKEVRNTDYMRNLKNTANALGAELVLVWVTAPPQVCRQRMVHRNAERDRQKLAHWESYIAGLDFLAPYALLDEHAVDQLFVFNNADEASATHDLENFWATIGG